MASIQPKFGVIVARDELLRTEHEQVTRVLNGITALYCLHHRKGPWEGRGGEGSGAEGRGGEGRGGEGRGGYKDQ